DASGACANALQSPSLATSTMPLVPIDAPIHDPILGAHPPARLARIGQLRALNVALVVGLIVLGVLWELWLAPLPGGRGTLAIKVLPLAFAVTG
ncbi:DUF2069 domain-containing protein, partial [Glaesserella parasuis]|uniref:DUF2069 domain-containing protein n=1 Tax=Glaesserella parasuis TaxID=738 RepID=UPI003B67A9BB